MIVIIRERAPMSQVSFGITDNTILVFHNIVIFEGTDIKICMCLTCNSFSTTFKILVAGHIFLRVQYFSSQLNFMH